MTDRYNTLVQRYITAQNTGDFDLFKSLFNKSVHKEVTETNFFRSQIPIKRENGSISDAIFIGSLHKEHHDWLLFKVTFEDTEIQSLLTFVVQNKNTCKDTLGIWLN